MGDIFRLSSKTTAWLGPESNADCSGQAYELIAILGKEASELDVRYMSLEDFTSLLNENWMEKEYMDESLLPSRTGL
jgi:hypothetical protein